PPSPSDPHATTSPASATRLETYCIRIRSTILQNQRTRRGFEGEPGAATRAIAFEEGTLRNFTERQTPSKTEVRPSSPGHRRPEAEGDNMHDHDAKNAARHSEPGAPPEQSPPASRRRWLRRLFGRRAALIGLPVLVGGGLLAGQALAGRGFAFGHGCRHHAMSDEQLVEHVNARLDFVLD